jgi:hypothetical protein
MICKLWLEFIGEFGNIYELFITLTLPSDGQKRPVFIYRLLTTGTIDGSFCALFLVDGRVEYT